MTNERFYKSRLKKHKNGAKAVGYDCSEVLHNSKYQFTLRNAPKHLGKVLEIGCGIGYGLEYLQKHHEYTSYVGIDTVKEFIEKCEHEHGQTETEAFICTDAMTYDMRMFDTIIFVGVFDINHDKNHWDKKNDIFNLLRFAVTAQPIRIYFNGLDRLSQDFDNKLYYHDVADLSQFLVFLNQSHEYTFSLQQGSNPHIKNEFYCSMVVEDESQILTPEEAQEIFEKQKEAHQAAQNQAKEQAKAIQNLKAVKGEENGN